MTKVAELTLLKKIQVPTEVATDPLEFLDFKTKFDKECKQIFEGVLPTIPTILHMFSLVRVS